MPIEKAEVLEVLRDPRLHNINFSVGPIKINSDEYDRVSDYVSSGAIGVVPWKRSYSLYDPPSDTIHTRSADPPLDPEVRSNLLHECTHAVADINKVSITRLADETAARTEGRESVSVGRGGSLGATEGGVRRQGRGLVGRRSRPDGAPPGPPCAWPRAAGGARRA